MHVMLYGNTTGQPYGWATPAELAWMLAGDELGPDCCPPAAGGHRDDWYLIPSPSDYDFWLAWHDRRGRAVEWINAADPPPGDPEMVFYMGCHRPAWLWNGAVDCPLCISYSTLADVRNLHRGRVRWICDSRAFTELTRHGRWTIPPEQYVRDVARYDNEIGGLDWAGQQDWPCTDEVTRGGQFGRLRAVGTGLTVYEHQARTVENLVLLHTLWPQHSDRPCPFIPTLQGATPDEFVRCYEMFLAAGVLLGEEHPVVGVGSVVRLQATGQLKHIARALAPLNLGLHWFGLKITGLGEPALFRDLLDPFTYAGTQSCDSATWSETARLERIRLPECTHTGRQGQLNPCNNCPDWAVRHRATKIIPAIRDAINSPARFLVQESLFPGELAV